MASDKDTDSELKLTTEGPFTEEHKTAFRDRSHFDEIFIRDQDLITVKIAKELIPVRSVHELTVWCSITRAAMRHVVSRPNLQQLVVLWLKHPGQMAGFIDAKDLTYFSCLEGLGEADLIEVAQLPNLQRLGAQWSKLSGKALEALLAAPHLAKVDFECSNFNDDFAGLVAQSKTITELELGETKVTKAGLEKICTMTQLKALDIWSTNIAEPDLDMLAALTNLEYLSIGGNDNQTTFAVEGILPRLGKLPLLKELWLDGFQVTRQEWDDLNSHYEKVRVSAVID